MPPRIRPPLKPGEQRRHEVVKDDDPDRIRLLVLCQLRDSWVIERKPKKHRFLKELRDYVLDNLGLCIRYARDLDEHHVPEEDVVQQAVLAFTDAIMRFDTKKAGRISTYALHRLRYETELLIQDQQGAIVRVPGQLRDDHATATKIVDQHTTKYGGISDEDLLDALRQLERDKNVEREKSNRKARIHWNKSDERRQPLREGELPPLTPIEAVREARHVYVGPEYSELRVSDSDNALPTDERLALRQAIATLPPKLRAAIAVEFGIVIHEDDLKYVAPNEPMHDIAVKLAVNLLGRRLV